MRQAILNIIKYHIIPILIAFVVSVGVLICCKNSPDKIIKTKTIEGTQKRFSGNFSNFDLGNEAEIEFVGNLQNKQMLTLLGSSEFQSFKYSSYFFLPDSLNIPTKAFGHAHHQSFSMYCELLAMEKHIKNSKICVFISPGWFETEGTNIEAFLEFVRPNFLKSIIHNDNISKDDKLEIGKYVSSKFNDINEPSKSLQYFKNIYQTNNIKIVDKIFVNKKYEIENVKYCVNSLKFPAILREKLDLKKIKNRLQKTFISSIKSNKLFVSDEYYNQYLLDEEGKYLAGEVGQFDVNSNQEYADLMLLIKLLKKNNCNASFVIQPLSVYHYKNLDNYNELISSIEKVLIKNKFPFLNMFVTKKQDYEPGTLNDIMHLGDYGWMNVNEFLVNTYKK